MTTWTDDFDRGTLGPDWTLCGGGTQQITSNRLAHTASGTSGSTGKVSVYTPIPTLTDQTVQATLISGNQLGVVARCSSSANAFYLLYFSGSGTTVTLYKYASAAYTSLGSTTVSAVIGRTLGSGDIAKIDCTGTTITGYINGTGHASLTATDSAISSGYGGCRTDDGQAGTWDDFSITGTLPPGPLYVRRRPRSLYVR